MNHQFLFNELSTCIKRYLAIFNLQKLTSFLLIPNSSTVLPHFSAPPYIYLKEVICFCLIPLPPFFCIALQLSFMPHLSVKTAFSLLANSQHFIIADILHLFPTLLFPRSSHLSLNLKKYLYNDVSRIRILHQPSILST